MDTEKIRVCWYCFEPYTCLRSTSRYCSDLCRVNDHNRKTEAIRLALSKLEADQKSERVIKAHNIRMEYIDKLSPK